MPKRGDKFPHHIFDIDDQSRRPLPAPELPGLHQPVYFIFAERGPVNVPVKGSYAYLSRIFGTATFATKSKYFQHPSLFARTAAAYQEIWVVRLADATAAKSSLVLVASVKDADVVQYEKDANGARVLDVNGDPVPLLEADQVTEVTEPGVQITWSVQPIDYDNSETLTNLLTWTTMDGADEVTHYPIIALEAHDVSGNGDNIGIKFFYDPEYETSVVANTDAMTYKFAPVLLDTDTDIATPIRDIYDYPEIEVTLKREAYDASIPMYYDLEERIRNQYTSTDGNAPHSLLGFDVNVYDANVALIANRILGKSPELTVTEWLVNIVNGIDENGVEYDHAEFTNASTFVASNRINYMQGGSDGSLTATTLHTLTEAYLGGEVYPAITDEARYPFTHVYDSGYPVATKYALIDFLGVRRDVKVDISTQDVSLEPNTASEDQSAGSSLRSQAALHPESTFFGTPVIRCSIYQQCGRLAADTTYLKWVPATMDRMIKRCQYDAAQKIKGQPTGLPNSVVDIFTELNWAPASDSQKRLNWATGLNYIEYYDTDGVHFADYRSVYPYDDSILSDDIACDYLVYIMHLARRTWAETAGLRERNEALFKRIQDKIDAAVSFSFNGKCTTVTTAYKTAEDEARGYSSTVSIRALFPTTNRVLNFVVPVDRQA